MGRNNSNRSGGNSNRGGGGKGKAMKYEIRADIKVNGTVQRKDIIGAIMGIPAPGDPFWTELTLARTRDRWPNSDWSAYDKALLNQPVD